jgi:hypothetical protein
MNLAFELGQPNVNLMLSGMTSRDLAEWMAFYRIEPHGEHRRDLRAGVIAAASANVWLGRNDKMSPLDFVPRFGVDDDGDIEEQDPEEVDALLGSFCG